MLQYFTLASVITLLTHAYFAWRLRPRGASAQGAARPRGWRIVRGFLVANVLLLPGAMVLTLRAPATAAFAAVPLAHVAFTDVGFCLLLFAGLLARDVGLAFAWLLGSGLRRLRRQGAPDPSRRRLLLGGLNQVVVGVAGGATVVGYGLAQAPPVVQRVRVPVTCARVPLGWAGLRVAQISDLHVGPTIRRGYVEQIVATVNALEADVIVITGDLVDGFVSQLAVEVAPLGGLRARHGVFFVTGNHEYFYRADEWIAALEAMGIRTLANAHALLDHAGAPVLLVGIDDPSAGAASEEARERALLAAVTAAPMGALRILLAHRPSDVTTAAQGFDVQLSGHLHGGQFFPLTLLLWALEPHVAGLYRVASTWLYVNRGAGYWGPPNRLGVRQEISLLEIVRA